MRATPDEFAAAVSGVVAKLDQLADGLAHEGMLEGSATVLAARQAIRVLWTQLHPSQQEPPEIDGCAV